MPLSIDQRLDLPRIVAICNAAIPGRIATADTSLVALAARKAWFTTFDAVRRPRRVLRLYPGGETAGRLSLASVHGRRSYGAKVARP